jgi:TRAP-type C4-dicarboxylate transport system substrate-binding protein
MKRLLFAPLAILMAAILLLSACGQTTSTTTSASTPSTTAAAASTSITTTSPAAVTTTPDKVYTIRWADMDNQLSWTAQKCMIPWTEAVVKATGGKVKFEIYWDNTLSKQTDNWESLKSGIADGADCVMSFWPGLAPLSDLISLPFLGISTAEQAGQVMWKLYEKYPSLQAEYKDVHVLFIGVADPFLLQTNKKQVKTLENIKGLKIRITGGPPTEYLKNVGASPVLVGMVDVYTNLQKGVLDGVVGSWATVESMKFFEVAKYLTEVPVYSPFAVRAINLKYWNSLPADIQKQIDSVGGFERSRIFSKAQYDDAAVAVKAKNYDIQVYTPPASELARWQEAAKPVWDKWVQDMTKAGHPEAQDMLNTALELIKTYKK